MLGVLPDTPFHTRLAHRNSSITEHSKNTSVTDESPHSSPEMNHDNSATSIRSDSEGAESIPLKKPHRFDQKCRKRKHRTQGLNIPTAHHSPLILQIPQYPRVPLVCLRRDLPLFLLPRLLIGVNLDKTL